MPRVYVKGIKAEQYGIYHNVVNYVAKSGHCVQRAIGAVNILLPNDERLLEKTVVAQIQNIRDFYGQNDTRLGLHVNINFAPSEVAYLNHKNVLELGYYLSLTEFPECMTYFAVHDHTQLLHLDMLLIPMSIKTGKMYSCPRSGWNAIMQRLCNELMKYMPEEAIELPQVAFSNY